MNAMIDVVLWNSCLAATLAITLVVIQRFAWLNSRPHLCHALWLLVLIKLVTPPLWQLSVAAESAVSDDSPPVVTALNAPVESISAHETASFETMTRRQDVLWSDDATDFIQREFTLRRFVICSLAVSFVILLFAARASWRIRHAVQTAALAPRDIQQDAELLAQQFGIQSVPLIRVVNARVSPFLWWNLNQPIIVLPQQLCESLDGSQLRLVLRHELAHFLRRDHLTNLLASGIVMTFWWNPVAWWARRELRGFQEQCCDSMVLDIDAGQKVRYAETLMAAVDFVAVTDPKCPAPATTFGDSRTLKRRIEMIFADDSRPKTLRTRIFTCAAAMLMLPIGMTSAQDFEAVERRLGEAVADGEISLEQANIMMEALRHSRTGERREQEMHSRELREHVRHRIEEIKQAVERGEVSREDAARMIRETERAAHERGQHERHEQELRRREFVEVQQKLRGLVEAGKLSAEDAEEKLIAVRRELFGDRDREEEHDDDLRERKEKFEIRVRRVKAAVQAGEMSAEEAERVLAETREALFEDFDDDEGEEDEDEDEVRELKEKYALVERRIKAAVEEGDLSAEDAEKKLIVVREEFFGRFKDSDDEESEDVRTKYRNAAEKIEAAAEAGNISREEAEELLLGLRKKMAGQKGKKKNEESELKQRYEEMEGRIKAAVESGEMSYKDAEEKLIAIRKEMFSGKKKPKKAGNAKDRYADYEREVAEAVESGKLTEEQAEEKLEAIRRKLSKD